MVSGVEWKDERSFIDMVTKSINKEWSTVDHIILNGFASIFFLRTYGHVLHVLLLFHKRIDYFKAIFTINTIEKFNLFEVQF